MPGDEGLGYELEFHFTIRVPLRELLAIHYLTERGENEKAAKRLVGLNERLRLFIVSGMDGKLGEAIFKATREARDEVRYRVKLSGEEDEEDASGLPKATDDG